MSSVDLDKERSKNSAAVQSKRDAFSAEQDIHSDKSRRLVIGDKGTSVSDKAPDKENIADSQAAIADENSVETLVFLQQHDDKNCQDPESDKITNQKAAAEARVEVAGINHVPARDSESREAGEEALAQSQKDADERLENNSEKSPILGVQQARTILAGTNIPNEMRLAPGQASSAQENTLPESELSAGTKRKRGDDNKENLPEAKKQGDFIPGATPVTAERLAQQEKDAGLLR